MHDQGALSEPCDARQDLIGAFRPDERLAGGIAGVEELPDGGLQPPHAPMRPTAELLRRQFREPAFHQVEPRRLGRREMQMEAWALTFYYRWDTLRRGDKPGSPTQDIEHQQYRDATDECDIESRKHSESPFLS